MGFSLPIVFFFPSLQLIAKPDAKKRKYILISPSFPPWICFWHPSLMIFLLFLIVSSPRPGVELATLLLSTDEWLWRTSYLKVKVKVLVTQSRPTLCDPMDCSPTGASVHGIFQARILEWVAMPSSRGSSQSKGSNPDLSHCRQILYHLSQEGSPNLRCSCIFQAK